MYIYPIVKFFRLYDATHPYFIDAAAALAAGELRRKTYRIIHMLQAVDRLVKAELRD